MTPVGTITAGLLLVLLDLRLSGFDVLPDVLGWVVVVRALAPLVPLERGFGHARAAAVVAGVLSLADLVHPTGPDGQALRPEGAEGVLSSAHEVAVLVVVALLAWAVRDRARAAGEEPVAGRFGLLAVVHAVEAVLLGGIALVAGVGGVGRAVEPQGLAAVGFVVVVLVGLAVTVWFLVSFAGLRTRPWLQPDAVGA